MIHLDWEMVECPIHHGSGHGVVFGILLSGNQTMRHVPSQRPRYKGTSLGLEFNTNFKSWLLGLWRFLFPSFRSLTTLEA
jgi:hypothetical protein